MSLPDDRRIAHGRTHAARWNALDYACSVKGYQPPAPVAAIYKAVGVIVLAVLLVPLALHLAMRLVS